MANINIYGELYNNTPSGFVTQSQQIMDTELGKRQNQINEELMSQVEGMKDETAFLICSTPGNTWKKVISAEDFVLSTNIRILVKMEHAHTSANSPTLNINGTGEYTIQYGGRGASNVNTWTDNEVLDIYFDGTQYIARGVENKVGYVVCNSLADNPEKTAICPAFNLDSFVRVLVKMVNSNTAASPTLNINGTGAKEIIYNGEAVSSENTWAAGEVLDVYYDGVKYQTNTYGGAKFESGEKVGNVSIEDYPVENSENLVKSGGLFNLVSQQVYLDPDSQVDPDPGFVPENDSVHVHGQQTITVADQKQIRANLGFGDGDIDEEPVEGSENVVKSGGLFDIKTQQDTLNTELQDSIASGDQNTAYVTCDTAAGTTAKVINDLNDFTLSTNIRLLIKMTYTNTANNPTLNINGTGAKGIVYNGGAVSASNTWEAGEVLDTYYNGTSYICDTRGGVSLELVRKLKQLISMME